MQNTTGKTKFTGQVKLGAMKNSISINEVYFENKEEDNPGIYSEEQPEELCKLLDSDSERLNVKEVHVNEVGNNTSPILYKVRVNDQPVTALFNTGVSMNVISTRLFDSLKHKPKYYNAIGHLEELEVRHLFLRVSVFYQ